MSSIVTSFASQPPRPHYSRPLAAAGAILTCPCHAVGLMLLTSGSALGAFLFRHITVIVVVMGGLFVLSCWALWQTRDSRQAALACQTCAPGEDVDRGQEVQSRR